jgi:hypothetical protein
VRSYRPAHKTATKEEAEHGSPSAGYIAEKTAAQKQEDEDDAHREETTERSVSRRCTTLTSNTPLVLLPDVIQNSVLVRALFNLLLSDNSLVYGRLQYLMLTPCFLLSNCAIQ